MSGARGMRLRGAGVAALVVALLAGCSVTEVINDATRIDYKKATKGPPLDVPPDLVTPRTEDRFAIPGRPNNAGTTFSEFSRDRAERPAPGTQTAVLVQPQGARIERQGNQRWLVVDQPPEKVWPLVRQFWLDAGFALRTDSPETGILETDWAERRPRVTGSWLRDQVSRALNSVYSTGERDKYRTRLESDGRSTEVFVSHRGLVEELSGPLKDSTIWVQRPSDPELEAEFVRRMLVAFTPARQAAAGVAPATVASSGAAPAAGAPAALPADRARIVQVDGRPALQIDDTFDRAWRQVGLSLDRGGFTVEDRDRSRGTFFVRYVDPEQDSRTPGLLDKVFGTGPKKDLSGKRYRIFLEGSATAGTRVTVLMEDGNPPATDADRRIATSIVNLLRDQLR